MAIRLLALTCGWIRGPLGAFLAGEHGSIRVPVPSFLIEHPRGRVVFDTGVHLDAARDPVARLGAAAAGVYTVELTPEEQVGARLRALGCDPASIRFAINSHLHFDHTGGNAELPNAVFLHQRAEWAAGQEPDQVAANAYNPRDYDLGHEVLLLDGEHDVFGDGSVVCLPTPGHTPGHQSLVVDGADGRTVLVGQALYTRGEWDGARGPGQARLTPWNRTTRTRPRRRASSPARTLRRPRRGRPRAACTSPATSG